jgi:hypothetical protein
MTPNQDIQGNSWTDEPEIPNTKREGDASKPKPKPEPPAQPQRQTADDPSSVQRPPADS